MRFILAFVIAGISVLLVGGCGAGVPVTAARSSSSGALTARGGPSPPAEATPAQPTPAATAPAPQAPPATQAPAPAPTAMQHVFPLMGAGGGSVVVTSQGRSITVTVTVRDVAMGLHAVHVHSACNGSTTAHLLSLSSVDGPMGSSSTTLPYMAPGAAWTVIVYPGAAAAGRPVLCAAIG